MEQEELRDYVKARLKVFYEEELDVPLVLFNEVLDHVLRSTGNESRARFLSYGWTIGQNIVTLFLEHLTFFFFFFFFFFLNI